MRFLEGIREGRTGICHMSLFAAVEAESIFEVVVLFFQGEFLDFHYIDVHGV